MLDVRSIYVSGYWEEYQSYRIERETERLYPERTSVVLVYRLADLRSSLVLDSDPIMTLHHDRTPCSYPLISELSVADYHGSPQLPRLCAA